MATNDIVDPILHALSSLQTELKASLAAHSADVNARLDRLDQDVQSLRRLFRESGQESERKLIDAATGFASTLGTIRSDQGAIVSQLGEVLQRLGGKREPTPYSTAADDNDRL